MSEIVVAIIGSFSIIAVALIESMRRSSKAKWEENKEDHNFVVDKIENLGKSLGVSIDRVEKGVERTESKVDQHIRDHAKGEI
jgi:hypothetical protein